MKEGDSMEKSEERNKIISELQIVIKEQVELKEIEIPGTITFQVMSVDGGNVPVGAGEVLLLRYSATHLEYSHELEDENQKFHMALHIIYCKEQKGECIPKTFSWLGLNEVRERLLKRRGEWERSAHLIF